MRRSPNRCSPAAVCLFALAAASGSAQPTGYGPQRTTETLQSALVPIAPVIDGVGDEPAWTGAPEASVMAIQVDGYPAWPSSKVSLRSVHTDREIFFLASWPDATRDLLNKPWVWDPKAGRYEEGDLREDSLALSFGLSGPFVPDMLAGVDAVWDVWHWKAGGSDPSGHAMDMTHRFFKSKPANVPEAKPFHAGSGAEIWVARVEDDGESVQKRRGPPATHQEDQVPQFIPAEPTESAADVRAKGRWSDGRWTVEFARRLDTRRADDLAFQVGHPVKMALAVFDHGELVEHQTSGVVNLTLTDPRAADGVATAIPPWLVGTWEMSDPTGSFGTTPTFSAFADGKILIFNPDGNHEETRFEGGALKMDGMVARPMLYDDNTLVLLYFNLEDEVFGSASVWARASREPKSDHKYEAESPAQGKP